MKAKILGKLIFLPAQSFIGKLLECSTAVADHKAMTAFLAAQVAFHESTT